MLPNDLAGWLAHIERQHPQAIELGLERVARAFERLHQPQFAPLFIVGGTNGKGSTCSMLDSILRAAGYRVGLYASPHLLRYNERVRINGEEAADALLVRGFAAVEAARGDVPLTYFEFGTLAAWVVFAESQLDALVLEVGLGGRLDAVNLFEPDCSIITSVDMDHMDYLGDTREKIGWEKAHIFRAGRPAICADPDPPLTLLGHARAIGAQLVRFGVDFGIESEPRQWSYWSKQGRRAGLAYPALRGRVQLRNAAAAIAALESLRERLPVTAGAIRTGLATVEVTGRFQVLPGQPTIILDVAHNAEAARVLADNLGAMTVFQRTYAVCAMLRDKDIAQVCKEVAPRIDAWHVAGLPGARGGTATAIADAVHKAAPQSEVVEHADVITAFRAAQEQASLSDRIIVFGSFLTVAAVLSELQQR
jgi:dihydrofolate synthase/folylpolyglutamate synthase